MDSKNKLSRRDFLKLGSLGAVVLMAGGCSFFDMTVGTSSASGGTAPITDATGERTLILYFSMPETEQAANMTKEEANSTVVINGKVLGNNEYFADIIGAKTKGKIVRLLPAVPYPTNHITLVAQAKKEKARNERPKLGMELPDLNDYDTIFIGYPIWWSDLPMLMYSMFDTYDFSGKTIIPFSTHGGSGWANTPSIIAELEPGAALKAGLSISRDDIEGAASDIRKWLEQLGY